MFELVYVCLRDNLGNLMKAVKRKGFLLNIQQARPTQQKSKVNLTKDLKVHL